MNTENTDKKKFVGWVLYDAECSWCCGLARKFSSLLTPRGLLLLPLQTPWVERRLSLSRAELLSEMRVLFRDGRTAGGADAVLEILRQFWWGKPACLVGKIPGLHALLRIGYAWVAKHRYCANGVCAVGRGRRLPRWCGFVPLLSFSSVALFLFNRIPAWVFMWTMAFALFAGCKWLTYWEARRSGSRPTFARSLGYLVAWPGMKANEFLFQQNSSANVRNEWILASAKTCLGIALTWFVAPKVNSLSPLAAGWVGMMGIVFFLHFGVFHLLSVVWRQFNVNARPIMENPARSCSLAEFWGRRWNTAFHELVCRFTFRPIAKASGPTIATLAAFLISGLVHELVISLPARAGFGLPTLYFIFQALGIIIERSRVGSLIGLGRGLHGWFFTFCITALPAVMLFHPPFVEKVILPMLQAIGAIGE